MTYKKHISCVGKLSQTRIDRFEQTNPDELNRRYLKKNGFNVTSQVGWLICGDQHGLIQNAIDAHNKFRPGKEKKINFGEIFEALNITTKQAAREFLTEQKMTNDDIKIIMSENQQLAESPQTSDTRPREVGVGGAAQPLFLTLRV